jgi:predicted acetyltransferase
MALTVEARAALWQYCFNVDLVATVKAVDRPIDDPLRWMLADPRRLRVPRLGDFLWVRLVDLPAALMARRYSATDCLVFEVEDPFCLENSGRYQLAGGSDGAECRRSSAEPDISLQVADLGATFLGGVRFDTLARAGRVHEQTPGAIRRADAMFASDPAPWCTTEF